MYSVKVPWKNLCVYTDSFAHNATIIWAMCRLAWGSGLKSVSLLDELQCQLNSCWVASSVHRLRLFGKYWQKIIIIESRLVLSVGPTRACKPLCLSWGITRDQFPQQDHRYLVQLVLSPLYLPEDSISPTLWHPTIVTWRKYLVVICDGGSYRGAYHPINLVQELRQTLSCHSGCGNGYGAHIIPAVVYALQSHWLLRSLFVMF